MTGCCSPQGYSWVFSERRARNEGRRYRRRGLDATSRRIYRLLLARGVEGRTLLEIGGGIGALQIELLRAGASRAVSVEVTPTYERTARELLGESGLSDRVERRVLDFAEAGGEVGPEDIVIMNRVVCCYPDVPTLIGRAAEHARQVMVVSYPQRRWWTRLAVGAGNAALQAARRHFQVFVHRPETILATAAARGLTATTVQPGPFWMVAELRRSPQAAVVTPPGSRT